MEFKQALSILGNPEPNDIALKQAYREACKKYHPDNGGDLELMKLVNLAYDHLKNLDFWWTAQHLREAKEQTPLTETIKNIFDKIKHLEGIKIELIGSWLWVTGNTRQYKEILKNLGFRFSGKKLAWYYKEGKFNKACKELGLNEIRSKYNSTELETEELKKVA